MQIKIESMIEGAARATGSVAIIDVFRAFTTAAVAFANGATHITMVASVEEAIALRSQGIGKYCMGEVHGQKPDTFDFGNSPYELSSKKLNDTAIIQRTSAGTQGIVTAAKTAQSMFAASLLTAKATTRALLATNPNTITLVAMGLEGQSRTMEDEICALQLRNLLEGRSGNNEAVRQMILSGGEAAKFGDPQHPWLNPNDLTIALDIDRYDFAIRVKIEDGRPVARMERPSIG